MKSKRIKKVLISIAVIFLVLSVSYKIYDSRFEAHQTRDGVFEYNDYVYKRLEWLDGYYVRNAVNDKIGNITPDFFGMLTDDKWYIYDFCNDEDNKFLAVKTKNQWGYFHVCYRSDMILPEVNESNINSLEIIPGARDDKYENGGLFNNDFTMNEAETVYTITDRNLIKEIMSDYQEDSKKELSSEYIDYEFSEDQVYYVITSFKEAPEELCFLVGTVYAEKDKLTLGYSKTPFGSDSIFYW